MNDGWGDLELEGWEHASPRSEHCVEGAKWVDLVEVFGIFDKGEVDVGEGL